MRKIGIGHSLVAAVLGLCFACAMSHASPSNGGFMIRNGDRVVFYGDSITDGEWYPTLVETYVLTRYPWWRNHFSNRGVSGDNSGSTDRFARDVLGQHADFFTYNMGFNDGGYRDLNGALLTKYLGNVETTVSLARKANPGIRMLIASPIANEVTVSADTRWVSHENYPYTMLAFGDEEAKLAKRLEVPFVDTGLLYSQTMGLGKIAAGESFNLSRDGVHPTRAGQTFLACHMLGGLGASSLVASVAIDARRVKVTDSQRCRISGLTATGGGLTFTSLCQSLPYPTPPDARPFGFLARIDDNLSADMLTVTGLSPGAYTLSVDGQRLDDIDAADLAEGINLTRYPASPMYQQAMAVFDAVRAKQVAEAAYWHRYISPGKADGAGNPTSAATADERTAMAAARAVIAAGEDACYAINTPKPHIYSLVPTSAKVGRFDSRVASDINQASVDLALTPVAVNWNDMTLTKGTVTVTVDNPDRVPHTGSLSWGDCSAWAVTPRSAPFSLEPGKSQAVTFALTYAGGPITSPPPSVTARWPWSTDWPYAMTVTRQIELAPTLTIARAKLKPTLSGDLGEWDDATKFILDNIYFVDPADPGKKLMWGGPQDLSGTVFLKWDDAALYAAVLVHDDQHVQTADDSMMWSEDSIMYGLNMTQAGKPDGRYEFGFAAYKDHDALVRYRDSAAGSLGPDIAFKSHLDAERGTCLYETVMPWPHLAPFAPAPGRTFGFTIAMNDADYMAAKGFNYITWSPGIHFGKNAMDLATLVLGGEPSH